MKSEWMSFQSSVFSLQRGGFRPSSFIHFLFLVWIYAANPLHAAPPPKEIPTFEFSAIRIGEFEVPPLYYLEVKPGPDGKPVRTFLPLAVVSGSRGQPAKVSLVAPVQIHTGTFDAKGKPDMKPYLDVPASSPKDRLLLVFYLDKQGKPQRTFLDDSAAAHPPGSVRVANLGTERIAFTVGGASILVAPGGDAKAWPVNGSDGRFPFIDYVVIPGEHPVPSSTKLLRFRLPGQRMLVIYTTMPVDVLTGQQNPDGTSATRKGLETIAYRLFDTIGAPGAATGALAPVVPATKPASAAASTPTAVRPLSAQEQEIDLIAPGSLIPKGAEIEIEWEGGKAPTRTAIPTDELVRLRAPISRSATLRFAKGNLIGSASFGSSSRQHLVVLVPGTDATDPMSVLAFENSMLSHPLGGARLFNLTPYQLTYSVGKEIGYIAPREAAVLAFPSGESTIRLAVKAAAGWKMVSETRPAKPDADKRNAIFVYKLPGKDEFRVLEIAP